MLKTRVTFDTSKILDKLNNRFGIGSKAQESWSRIVFDGSTPYMPFREGNFMLHSEEVSKPLFSHGELLYEAPPEYNYDYLPMFLWTGRSRHGAIIIKNYTTETNAKAQGQWVIAAANDSLPVWVNGFQNKIDSGEV